MSIESDLCFIRELLASPQRVNLSALTGRGLDKLFPLVDEVLRGFGQEIPTAELNRLLEAACRRHHPPSHRGRAWKPYYATQVATGPPTFMIFANRTLPRSAAYRRYLENFLRDSQGWRGFPVRLLIRRRER